MRKSLLLGLTLLIGLVYRPILANNSASTKQETTQSEQLITHRIYLPVVSNSQYQDMWLSREQLMALPTSGPAWNSVYNAAQQDTSHPDVSDQDDQTEVYVLAKALVYGRTGDVRYRNEVIAALMAAINTEQGGRTLALGRNLAAYVIAADLITLSANPQEDQVFRQWLRTVLTEPLEDEMTLQSTHEKRPNNWGTHAGASRIAVAIYLGDKAELDRAAAVFHGWLGNRSVYDDFNFGDLSWQCDPAKPVGVNPAGCTRDGHSIDGVLPDDQRRGKDFTWPPPKENYVWEALQGAIVQAHLLDRAGYPAWEWEDRALLRAVNWLYYQANYPPEGDDRWQPWIINQAYNTKFPAPSPVTPGKGMGWTDWTMR